MRLAILITLFPVFILCSCTQEHKQKLPEFKLLLEDSVTIFESTMLPKDTPILLIQFSADCKECQIETEEILSNYPKFERINLVFMTYEPLDRLKVFNKHYQLQNYKNVVVGVDFEEFFPKHFNTRTTPYLAFFNKGHDLKAIIEGKTDINNLLNIVAKNSN